MEVLSKEYGNCGWLDFYNKFLLARLKEHLAQSQYLGFQLAFRGSSDSAGKIIKISTRVPANAATRTPAFANLKR
jgi:hypothetical protein